MTANSWKIAAIPVLARHADIAEMQPERAIALGREAGGLRAARIVQEDPQARGRLLNGGEEPLLGSGQTFDPQQQERGPADVLHGFDTAHDEIGPGQR